MELPLFEDVRDALRELLEGNVPPADRRAALQEMRETLVRAKMALDDLSQGVAATEKRLARERTELETVRRRKTLAEGIGDAQTVEVAARFETQQSERVALIEKKLEAEQGELRLVGQEVEEMSVQLKAAHAGIGSGMRSGGAAASGAVADDDLEPEASLREDLSAMERQHRRATREADAETQLAELKKRMGL